MTAPRAVARRAVALLVVAAAAACADFAGNTDFTLGLPDLAVPDPDFSREIMPIIERRCAIGGCHTVLSRQAGLVLTRDSAWRALVGQPSRTRAGEVLVRPGDAANSWLVVLIGSDDARRQGFSRMPLGSGPLTANQIATIINWIDRGAERE